MLRTFSSLPLAAQMTDGFKRFAPRGSPRGQDPPRIKFLHRLWQCLPLAAQMIDGFKRFAPRGSPRGQGPPRIKVLHCLWQCLPLAARMIDGFKRFETRGSPRGHGPPRIKFLHRPLAMYPCIRVRPCLTVRASILFSSKRINILIDEYLSAAKIRANRPQPYRQNSRQKIGTRSEIFFNAFFQKKRGKCTAMSYKSIAAGNGASRSGRKHRFYVETEGSLCPVREKNARPPRRCSSARTAC